MRSVLVCVLMLGFGCSDDKADTASDSGVSPQCPGNSIYVEVCIECGDAGGCEQTGYECRDACESDEDCAGGESCHDSDDGRFCGERYGCD